MENEVKEREERLRKNLEETINALSLSVEMRDPLTAGHQRRVTNLARAIAEEMGLAKEQIEGLHMAGLIHDVGKIQVPTEILSKPGHLSDTEFFMIKMHPQIGYDIVKSIKFSSPVAQAILQHHERIDGSGYLAGLSGNKILLEARILGVADVVEAMSSPRPYRGAFDINTALKEINKYKGVLYDTEIADTCLKLFKERNFSFE
jgi:putative nucleotidyltransferase with HDIG domain